MAAFFISSPIDLTSSLKARKQICSKAEKDRPIRVPFITTASRSPARSQSVFEREAYNTRRDQSRVCGKHRAVLRSQSPPRIPFLFAEVAAPGDLRQAQTFDFMLRSSTRATWASMSSCGS
ncbi:hypothetical protein EDB86DRAFT_1240036 [Lactarius hatsudake]|nr:hypothetical protein EDB86DRAFT_1240036 [Lactarius hatsudake]